MLIESNYVNKKGNEKHVHYEVHIKNYILGTRAIIQALE